MVDRDEKVKKALAILGAKHVLHASHHVQRRERATDPATVDVRRTFERVAGPDWAVPHAKPILAVVRRASR